MLELLIKDFESVFTTVLQVWLITFSLFTIFAKDLRLAIVNFLITSILICGFCYKQANSLISMIVLMSYLSMSLNFLFLSRFDKNKQNKRLNARHLFLIVVAFISIVCGFTIKFKSRLCSIELNEILPEMHRYIFLILIIFAILIVNICKVKNKND